MEQVKFEGYLRCLTGNRGWCCLVSVRNGRNGDSRGKVGHGRPHQVLDHGKTVLGETERNVELMIKETSGLDGEFQRKHCNSVVN